MRSAMTVSGDSGYQARSEGASGQYTDTRGSFPVPVAVADALHEAAFLVGQLVDALAGDLLQQLVEASLLALAPLLFLAGLALGPLLLPALPPALLGLRRRRRLVALQAGVAL